MRKSSAPSKDRRILFIIAFCAVAGAVLNGSAGWAQSNTCSQSENPTQECWKKSPMIGALEGGVMGVFAGTGAALGAVWRRYF